MAAETQLKEYGVKADQHWREVMELAERYGFILQSYGGTVILATHRNQMEEFGEAEYLRIQQMNGHCPKDCGYPGCLTSKGEQKECGSCWVKQRGAKWLVFTKNSNWKNAKGETENGV